MVKIRFLFSAAFCVFLFALPLHASTSVVSQSEIEAAYLLNFLKFVEWPADSQKAKADVYTICVWGDDTFNGDLDDLLGSKTIQNKKVTIYYLHSAEELQQCHLVFISGSEDRKLHRLLPPLTRAGVLTVSDVDNFTDRGGILGLRLLDNRMRFDVNLDAANDAHINISSQLLKLAHQIKGRTAPTP